LISGTEWIVIGVVAIVLVLWGPKKIPELARSLGKAKGEFDVATQEFDKATKLTVDRADTRTSDEILMDTAKKLGIETEGKTLDAISQEILEKTK
jgi:sec-independent protein translocase protein TatA